MFYYRQVPAESFRAQKAVTNLLREGIKTKPPVET